MIVRFKIYIVWIALFATGKLAFGNNPIPNYKSNDLLFKIQRSRDADEIIYRLNIDKNGKLIKSNPISINWLRNTDHQKTEPLSFIQQQYAYGIKFLEQEKINENEWYFQFVSYSKRTFILRKIGDLNYKVFTKIGNTEVALDRIYVLFKNKSFWFPSISAVELHGKSVKSGQIITEVVIP